MDPLIMNIVDLTSFDKLVENDDMNMVMKTTKKERKKPHLTIHCVC